MKRNLCDTTLAAEISKSSTIMKTGLVTWSVSLKAGAKRSYPQTRRVYLPVGNPCIDFWTGKKLAGGQTLTADPPIDKILLLVKAGSIVPMGPFLQYTTEKLTNPVDYKFIPA